LLNRHFNFNNTFNTVTNGTVVIFDVKKDLPNYIKAYYPIAIKDKHCYGDKIINCLQAHLETY